MNQPRPVRTSLFRNIGPIIFVSIIWGLVPKMTKGNLIKNTLAFCYSAVICIFYAHTLYTFNTCALRRIEKAATKEKLLVKIIYVETLLRCFLLFATLVVNFVKCDNFLRILEMLADFDDLLQRKLRIHVPTKRNICMQIFYTIYIIFFGCYYCSQLYAAKNDIVLSAQWAALCNVTLIILSQFTIFVHAFNARFKTFNSFFADMNAVAGPPFLRQHNSSYPSSHSLSYHGSGGGINDHINIERKRRKTYLDGIWRRGNYESVNAIRNCSLNVINRFKLKELHIIYLSMRDLLREINSYYSFQVLLIVCETIAILIAGISTVTFNITSDDFSSKTFDRQLTLLHCGFRLLSITLLIYVAERTSCEANSTVIIIHNFLKTEQTDEVKKALELFLLDLWHHKIKFNAHEFFDLDYQLIQSILSAAITYVIVLVQFQLATAYAS